MKVQSINKSNEDVSEGYYLATGHPLIDKPLENSRGQIVFQEDLMRLFASVCGLDFGQADNVRRITAKKMDENNPKHKAEIDSTKKQWLEGCTKNKIPKDISDKWWDKIIANAEYSFNRSHAYAYSLLTVVTAQLKAKYPLEFAAAYLSVYPNEKDAWLSRLFSNGYEFVSPNVNTSGGDTYGTYNGKVTLPLSIIDGLGSRASESIEQNQPFNSIEDFMTRVDLRLVDRTTRLKLWLIGAFDGVTGEFTDLNTSYSYEQSGGYTRIYDAKAKVADRNTPKFIYKSEMDLQSSILSGTIILNDRARDMLKTYMASGYEFGRVTKIVNGTSKSGTPRIEIHFGKSPKPQLFVSQKMASNLERQLGKRLVEGMFVAYKRDKNNWGGRYIFTKQNGKKLQLAIYDLTDTY